MIQKLLYYVAIFLSTVLFATAQETGIKFERGLNWTQTLAKAKKENKYIFVDCYTSWCGPCKRMDKDVYSLDTVGKFMNSKYISLKIQMDSSKKDDEEIVKGYADARILERKFKIDAYPTLLFFNPDGNIVQKSIGAKDPDMFISMAGYSLKSNYYTFLSNYHTGARDLPQMWYLAKMALALGDTATSRQVAGEYIRSLSTDSTFIRKNLEFIQEFTSSTKEKGFAIFYKYPDTINRIIGMSNYSEQFIQSIIYKEMIIPEFTKIAQIPDEKPNWSKLESLIREKYNTYYAGRVITSARSNWGAKQKNWSEYAKYLVEYMEKYGPPLSRSDSSQVSFVLNNDAWAVFQYSQKADELQKALSWSGRAVMIYPSANWIDTYANILYKLGQRQLSLSWEEIATKLDPDDNDIRQNLEKMKRGEPTWKLQ